MRFARLDEYFDETATRHPGRPAVQSEKAMWSYSELRAAKHRIAKSLRATGAGGDEAVGLLCEKSFAAYAGLLGILESGNMYVPLSPRVPHERLQSMLSVIEPGALVVDAESTELAADLVRSSSNPPAMVNADSGEVVHSGGQGDRTPLPVSGGPYAYLLFTSGSTGSPKGVGVTHRNASALLEALSSEFAITPLDAVTQFADLSFDFAIGEMFLCWRGGGRLCVPSWGDSLLPIDFVNRNDITVWSSVPTLANNSKMLGLLTPSVLPGLRLSLFCGEPLPVSLATAWERAAPSSTIVNLYGPTEATVFATRYVWDAASPPKHAIVPLGKPLRGFDVHILPSVESDSATGMRDGELLLAGPQVVPGYWRDPVATQTSFVRLSSDSEDRVWYRTGDLARFDELEGLIFMGRRDDQVKLRGYRVHLGEVEAAIRRVTRADLVAVVAVFGDDGLCEDLIAYCNAQEFDSEQVKTLCRQHLPDYLLPRHIEIVEQLPVNHNGKIDYVALSADAHRFNTAWTTKPGTES